LERNLPAPGRPRSSALALALGAVTSRGVRLLSSDGFVLGSGSVGDIGRGNCNGLGLGVVHTGGVGNLGDHGLGLNPGLSLDDWRLGANLQRVSVPDSTKRKVKSSPQCSWSKGWTW
jgi:hypothetical protein